MTVDLQSVLSKIAIEINAELGRGVTLNFGVDNELADAIAAMPDSEVKETVYVDAEEAYVIRSARATVGRVVLSGQNDSHPATSAEVESAGAWTEHVVAEYRSGELRKGPP